MAHPTAVLFLTHSWDRWTAAKFDRLQREVGDRADCFVLAQRSPELLEALRNDDFPAEKLRLFLPARLTKMLGFPFAYNGEMVPGSTHYPLLAFSLAFQYDHYLLIEFDVDFSGGWGRLVDHLVASGSDFGSSHICTRTDQPDWIWWDRILTPRTDAAWYSDEANQHRSFNPVLFFSRTAIELLVQAHRSGWIGHYEIVVPTVLARHGAKMFDLAKEGYCEGDRQGSARGDRGDVLSTMRWKPYVIPAEFQERSTGQTLFHPIKFSWHFDGEKIVYLRSAKTEDE